jgi:predicted nucleic acid-binding protein
MAYYAVKVHYFDASALVKLVADDLDEEPGRKLLRKYHNQHAHPGYTTSFCIAEAFGALKRKFLYHKISQAQYLKFVKDLIRITGNTFQIDLWGQWAPPHTWGLATEEARSDRSRGFRLQ